MFAPRKRSLIPRPADSVTRSLRARLDAKRDATEISARILQDWFRNKWQRIELWSAQTGGCQICAHRHEYVLIVEPCGRSFAFYPTDLAAIFLASARFEQPVTRRTMVPVEVARIRKKLGHTSSFLLQCTFDYRDVAQKALSENGSLTMYLHEVAGGHLDGALLACEPTTADDYMIEEHLEAYEASVREIRLRIPLSLESLLQQHSEIVQRRFGACEESHWNVVRSSVRYLQMQQRNHQDMDCSSGADARSPACALGIWLASARA